VKISLAGYIVSKINFEIDVEIQQVRSYHSPPNLRLEEVENDRI